MAGGAPGQPDGERNELRAHAGRRRQAAHVPRREPQRYYALHGNVLDHQRRL